MGYSVSIVWVGSGIWWVGSGIWCEHCVGGVR